MARPGRKANSNGVDIFAGGLLHYCQNVAGNLQKKPRSHLCAEAFELVQRRLSCSATFGQFHWLPVEADHGRRGMSRGDFVSEQLETLALSASPHTVAA